MKISTKHKALFICSAIVITLYGCIKEEDLSFDKVTSGQWNPEFAVPLINSSLSINDITGMTDTSMFATNSNNQISLIYKTNIYTSYGYEFFTPVNQSSGQTLQLFSPDSIQLYTDDSIVRSINLPLPLTFPNGEQIDSMTFRSGALRINVTSYVPHDAILTISIPSAVIGGQPFIKDIPVSAGVASPTYTQDIFDMSGYNMNTSYLGMPNTLNIDYTLKFTNSGTTLNTLNKNFDITTSFDSISPASLFGFLGQREFLMPADTSEIGIFSNFQGGGMFFDNPKMTITLENSFGMPIDAQIGTLSAIQSNGTAIPITGPYPSPLIDYPIVFGQSAYNSFTFDNTNSNIQTALNSSPQFFVYNLSAGTNALPTYNFMSDSSVFKADLKIEFPLRGYATGFTIQDTVDLSLGEIDMVESVSFRINI